MNNKKRGPYHHSLAPDICVMLNEGKHPRDIAKDVGVSVAYVFQVKTRYIRGGQRLMISAPTPDRLMKLKNLAVRASVSLADMARALLNDAIDEVCDEPDRP